MMPKVMKSAIETFGPRPELFFLCKFYCTGVVFVNFDVNFCLIIINIHSWQDKNVPAAFVFQDLGFKKTQKQITTTHIHSSPPHSYSQQNHYNTHSFITIPLLLSDDARNLLLLVAW